MQISGPQRHSSCRAAWLHVENPGSVRREIGRQRVTLGGDLAVPFFVVNPDRTPGGSNRADNRPPVRRHRDSYFRSRPAGDLLHWTTIAFLPPDMRAVSRV